MYGVEYSPFPAHVEARRAFASWGKYMEDLRLSAEAKLSAMASPPPKPDVLGKKSLFPLYSHLYHPLAPILTSFPAESLVLAGQGPAPLITPSAITGNMFILLLAGHETTASSLQFALLCLACHPTYQRRLQASLDTLLGPAAKHSPSTWDFTALFPRLLRGYPGAVLRETVRLFTVLPVYLRCTEDESQALVLNGKTYMVPPDTLIMVNTSAAHRNPKYWPRPSPPENEEGDGEEAPYALAEFDPGRWIDPETGEVEGEKAVKESGAYVPFSKGSRECLGKRFAEVEVLAMLARVFCEWSLELVVEDGVGGERERWERARRKCARMLSRGIGFQVALKMMGEVPLRIVRRGEEKWRFEE